jgi:hypothetical protein
LSLQDGKHTSAIERPHSHHHLDVSSACWRHLCVYLMPAGPPGVVPLATPLRLGGLRYLDNVCYPKFDSTGVEDADSVFESSEPRLIGRWIRKGHTRYRSSSDQGGKKGCVYFVNVYR